MKRRLLPLLLLPCLLLTGCWQDAALTEEEPYPDGLQPQEEETVPLPETLSLPWYNGVTLDPVTCPDGAQQTVAALLYEGLYALDPSFTPQPRLCEDAQPNGDATVWTLTLRQDVRFSDGTALRPRDVVATLQRARESERYGQRLAAVTSVSESRGKVVIRLSRANSDLPALLDIPIVKSGTQDAAVPTGTGAYTLSSDGEGSFLTANPGWWQGKALPTEAIRLVDCGDESAVQYQFSSHGVQLLVSDQTGAAPLRDSRADTAEADSTVLHCLLLNQKTKLLQSAAVRRCLSLGIDRESLVDACLSGHGHPAQFPISPASPLYPAALEEPYRYESFEDALKTAGLNTGETRTLRLLVCGDSKFKSAAASYLAAALSVCDLRVSVEALPWEDYLRALEKGDFDLCYAAVKLSADWDLTELLAPGGSLNYGGWQDGSLTQRIAGAAAAEDRASALSSLCRVLQRQAPLLPLCFESRTVLTQEGVFEGLTPTAADPFYGFGSWQLHLAG